MYDLVRSNEEKLRSGFKIMNKFMVILWKLGLADWINIWPTVFGQIMVITHKGRKTGYKRLSPVNFAIINGEIYCTAGFGEKCDWFQNILINPNVEVWLTEGRWEGIAEDISNDPDRLFYLREVLIASGFAAPLAGVHPKKINDETLDRLTNTYRLIKIKRVKERTGRDGPGELAWIWPLVTVVLLIWKGRRRKK